MAFQFGVFEVDPRAGELRKHGIRIKLQEQPLRILLCLMENAGQVVSRQQIQEKLWPDQTFVDYENAINSAVRKLREALNDSSENPRFVETLPRRGYRFLAPVTQRTDPAPPVEMPVKEAPPILPPEVETKPTRHRAQTGAAVVIVAVIAASSGIFWTGRENRVAPVALQAVPLTSFRGDEHYTAFSPDGSQVAFSWNGEKQDNFDIYVMLIGSGRPLRLTTDPAIDLAPAWSPDGRTIAFVRRNGEKLKFMIMPALGGSERELAELDSPYPTILFEAPPSTSWSPDGRWLLISGRESLDQPSALWLISVETSERRRLTNPPATYRGDLSGAFSRDGRSVAIVRSSAAQNGDVYVLPLAADFTSQGEPRRLTKENRQIAGIAWTADGGELVYSAASGTSWSLWRVPLSGSSPPVRLSVGENGLLPSISPRGNRLSYTTAIVDLDIARVDLFDAGKQPVPLIVSTQHELNPQYSRDGKRVAFESSRSGKLEVWVCDADGSNATQLVTMGRSGSPYWSPDGQWIVFDSNVSGNWQIYIVSSHGGSPRRMTNVAGNNVRPSWSPDGKWIYFASNRSAGEHYWQVWKMPAGGGDAVQLTKNGGYMARPSEDGKVVYFAKNDSYGHPLWKVPAEGGDETEVIDGVGSFAVTGGGIYYSWIASLQFLDFSTGRSRPILNLGKPAFVGLTVSSDNRWLLVTQRNEGSSDLMLVENFR